MSGAGIRALVGTPAARLLRVLEFWNTSLSPEAACAIAESPHLGSLWRLWMGYNQIGAVGARLGRVRDWPRTCRRR